MFPFIIILPIISFIHVCVLMLCIFRLVFAYTNSDYGDCLWNVIMSLYIGHALICSIF